MVEFKIVIADPKTGKSHKKELKDKEATFLIGKKIGDKVELPGMQGYEFLITGGSDYAGFPMRADIQGTVRKRIYAKGGVGFRIKKKGEKLRKTVCGNTIHARITQINMKIVKYGSKPLEPKDNTTGEKTQESPDEAKKVKGGKEEKVKKEETKAEVKSEKGGRSGEEKKEEKKEEEKKQEKSEESSKNSSEEKGKSK